jgi:hypothetical protein
MRVRACWPSGIAALVLAAGCAGEDGDARELVSATTSELTRTFTSGALIIPLDTTLQDAGALRAYGLVYQLLSAGIPVQWAILAGKPAGGNDFTISAPAVVDDLETGARIALPISYRGGPFIIDAADRADALPLVTAWLADGVTVVHSVTGTFTADIAKTLTAAPRVALLQDGFEQIAIADFNAAGIPDSTGAPWSVASADVLSEAAVAGPTTTSHADGALWNADGTPRYCNVSAMHYNPTATTPEIVQEVRSWLDGSPGNHAFMQCLATMTFENAGHFVTTGGIVDDGGAPASLANLVPDDPLTQTDGALQADTGAVDSIGLAAGSSFAPGVRAHRDVLQIRIIAGQATGHRDCLPVVGVNSACGRVYHARQLVGIRALELGQRAVVEYQLRQRIIERQFLQHVFIGGRLPARRFLQDRQLVLFEQDLLNLPRRIEIECNSGQRSRPRFQLEHALAQLRAVRFQQRAVDENAVPFHLKQHPRHW